MDRRQPPPRHRRAPIERHRNSFNSLAPSLARAAASVIESLEVRQLLSGTPPTLAIDGPAAVNEGSAYTLSLSASAGANLTSWAVNWGDGTSTTLAGGATSATHAYADGPHGYTITATGTNTDGTFNAIHPAAGGGTTATPGTGALDVTFGNAGKVLGAAVSADTCPVLVQPDGKIVVGGNTAGYDFQLVRYNADGSVDNTFGNNGVVTTDLGGTDLMSALAIETVQVTGQSVPQTYIVAVGSSNDRAFAVARYNLADGSLDATFGNGGKVLSQFPGFSFDDAHSVAIRADGDIIVGGTVTGGTSSFALAAYRPDGSPDPTFGTNGLATPGTSVPPGGLNAITVLPDGSILGAGQAATSGNDAVLVRFKADGSLDTAFGNNGIADAGPGNGQALAALSDGSAIMAGLTGSGAGISVEHFFANGTLDTAYGNNGSAVTVIPNNGLSAMGGLVVQPDGSAVVGASVWNNGNTDFALLRFTSTGTADGAFGTGGVVYTDVGGSVNDALTGLAIDASGRIVAAGRSRNASTGAWQLALARYAGGQVASSPLTVQVANVAPSVTLSTPTGTLNEGSPVSLTATVTDPGTLDNPTAAWTVTDSHGNAVASGVGTAITFTPADNGAYVVAITATDKDGGVGSTTQTVNVANVAPTLKVGGDTSGVRGQNRTLTLTAADPSTADAAAGFTYVINWGDGTTQTVHGGATATVTHAYALDWVYHVTVTATDKDGGRSAAAAEDMTIVPWQIQGRTLAIGGLTADDLIILTENNAKGTQTIKLSDDILFGASFNASQFDTIALYQSDDDSIVVAHSLTVAVELVNADGSVLETLYAGK